MHWIDPDSLPEIVGAFERFILNPHGDPDGLILADGGEVHFPPHLAADVRAAVEKDRKGALRFRGVWPRGGSVFAAVAIETASGRIIDNGPPKQREEDGKPIKSKQKREPMTAEGVVRRALHGPKGETRGALLEDERIIRFAPHEASRLTRFLLPGQPIAVRGEGLTSPLGVVIEAREIGRSTDDLESLGAKKPKPEKRHGPETPAPQP
ncbi:MAG TPA: hypothetical protein VKS78_02145 [Roseiarcus sp.]|nr:hypothetical protein [Roseiarcus sp.]